MKRGAWLVFCAFVFALPAAIRAQAVRGVVIDQTTRPIGGVVVSLVDSASRTIARALSDPQGQFRIAAPAPGVYRVRTLRIGFRPVLSDPFELKTGQDVTRQIVVTNLPTALDTIRVVDRNVCRAFTDSGAATYAVWEQVRAALTATDITAAFHNIAVTTVGYERVLDPKGGRNANRVVQQKATVSTGYVNRPWRTLPPDSLRRIGYVVTERDESVVYYAPGIDMLLSSAFAADHCFRLTTDKQHADLIGLAFEPTSDRRRTAEIKGNLWVDRKSSELRRLEFEYVNVPAEQAEQAGGNLEFVRMRDGTWAISRWFIQMPAFTSVVVPGHGAERQLAELQAAGGEIALARRGADTLWAQPAVVLSGTIRDSISGAGVGGAKVSISGTDLSASTDDRGRFSISGMLPGVYEAEINTPSLDSLSASHRVPFQFLNPADRVEWRVPNAKQLAALVCGDVRDPSRGMVIGRARLSGDTAAPRNLSVLVEWLATAKPTDSTAEAHEARARGGSKGSFRLCRVPVKTSLRIRATADGAETAEPKTIQLQSSSRMAHADLDLQPLSVLAARGSTFTGVVVSDSTHVPLGAAEVALPDLGKSVFTNAAGEFRIVGIPAGEHRVMVRKIGYGAADTRLAFGGKETVERRVVLGRAVTLEPMVVTASERVRQSFDENRRLGLGHFMTREDIAKYDGMDISSALQQVPTVGLADGHGHVWVTSRRHPFTAQVYEPSYIEKTQGMPRECWAQVYLDGVLQNGMKEPTEPFDLKQIPVDRVEAIEFYAGGGDTPLQYSKLGSQCGVLVIWTRRR